MPRPPGASWRWSSRLTISEGAAQWFVKMLAAGHFSLVGFLGLSLQKRSMSFQSSAGTRVLWNPVSVK